MKRSTHVLVCILVGLVLAVVVGAAVAAASPSHRSGRTAAVQLRSDARTPSLRSALPVVRTTTGPTPPRNVVFKGTLVVGGSVEAAPGEELIADVPAYEWRDGCGPTAVAMIVGYWDAHGYPDLVPGDASVDSPATQQMIASHATDGSPGHYEDYSLPMDETGLALDKSEPPAGDEHPSDSVADFMHTSWSSEGLFYGGSWSSMTGPGFTGYVSSKHPDSSPESSVYPSTALTWDLVKGEIDAGRPMVFMVDATADARAEHMVAAIGYREVNGYPEYACWDTWSTTIVRWQQFRPMSTSYGFGVWGGWTFSVSGGNPEDPEPTPTPTPTESPTPPADTTAPVTTATGADDLWHAENVTVTLSASDDSSGVSYTEYSVDGGAWVRGTSVTLGLGKRAVNSGVHSVAYRSADLAGNLEAQQYAYVKLDGKVPVTKSNAAEAGGTGPFTLILTPSDAHSGVGETYYALDGKVYDTGTSVQVTGKGTHSVKFYSVDLVGNAEGAKTVRIVIK